MDVVLPLATLLAFQGLDVALPPPTGQRPVGTSVRHLVDEARADERFPAGRPITLQLWYPAAEADGGERAPYLVEDGLARSLAEQGYYEVEAERIAAWAAATTHSRRDAAPAPGAHPLLTFSVGLGVVRANYTSLAEELASHGFALALVESPLAGRMVLPDGTVVQDESGALETAEGHRTAIDAWARDVAFVLDRLGSEDRGVALEVDWTRVGALGHSSGGLVAVQCATDDGRVRAAVDLDGGLVTPASEPLARFVVDGPARPTLILRSHPIYRDEDLARRGLTRAQWEARGAAGAAALEELARRTRVPLTLARIAGTGHFSFSDAPFVMPSAITRFGGEIIDPQRGLRVTTAAIRAFFEDAFGARDGRAFAEALREFPELQLAPRAPDRR
jgi:dienelactone hydrolase